MAVKMYKQTRDWYGEALVEIARQDSKVVALDCDLGRSTRSYRITEVDKIRFIEMGIAEQDMISTASGLASMGMIPFANSFAIFVTGRAFDQIRQQVSLPKANVKICGSSAGLTQGPDGATHQSVLDLAIMRTLPNMTVLSPADGPQTTWAVHAAHEYSGPVYIRLSRMNAENIFPEDARFELGKGYELKKGKEVVFVTHGPVTGNVVQAAKILEKRRLDPGIVSFPTIKPFDGEYIRSLAKHHKYIVSVEEHSIFGGLGTAVAEVLAETEGPGKNCSLIRLGVRDTYGESGSAEELLAKHGLDPEGIAGAVWDKAEL